MIIFYRLWLSTIIFTITIFDGNVILTLYKFFLFPLLLFKLVTFLFLIIANPLIVIISINRNWLFRDELIVLILLSWWQIDIMIIVLVIFHLIFITIRLIMIILFTIIYLIIWHVFFKKNRLIVILIDGI